MLRYGNNNFEEQNQEQQRFRSSYSQDESAITSHRRIRDRVKSYQELKKSQKVNLIQDNDSIPVLNNQSKDILNSYDNSEYFDQQQDDITLRRNSTYRCNGNSYKREAIKFDEQYLETNFHLQEFLLNTKTKWSRPTNIESNNFSENFDQADDADNDDDEDKLSNTILSSDFVYQNFCNECGYDIPSESESNVCDLCQYSRSATVKTRRNVLDKICMKCGVLFCGRDGAELCRNCQTIRNEQLLFEQNSLEKIYINECYYSTDELDPKNPTNSKAVKSGKNQKRFFHGIIDTLKRVKSNRKSEKRNNSNTSVDRLQIIHNVDGFDNVFHTKNTFDIKKISELKANSSQNTKETETQKQCGANYTRLISDQIDSPIKDKYNKIDSKSDPNLHKIRKIDSSGIAFASSSLKYDKGSQSTSKNSIETIPDEKYDTSQHFRNPSHSTAKSSNKNNYQNKSSNYNSSNNSNNGQRLIAKEKANSTANNKSYGNIYEDNGALKKQFQCNDYSSSNCKPDLSSMDLSETLKSIDSYDYCLVFDSVINWLDAIRSEQHAYCNHYDIDDCIFSIKNIPSRTTNNDYLGYNYLTAATTASTTTITTDSSRSYDSCRRSDDRNSNQNFFYSNFDNSGSSYPIYTEMKSNSKFYTSSADPTDRSETRTSGNSIFYYDSNETLSSVQAKNDDDIKQHKTAKFDSDNKTQQNEQQKQKHHNLLAAPSQAYSHSYASSKRLMSSAASVSSATTSLCSPYEFSNRSKDTESVHLHSSTEQQVISAPIGGGSINEINKQTVNINNSCQEIKKQQQQQKQHVNNFLQSNLQQQHKHQLNEIKSAQLHSQQNKDEDEGNRTKKIKNILNKDKNIEKKNCSWFGGIGHRNSDSVSSSGSDISELNDDEYRRHMVDNFKRNLMEKQRYNELMREQQQQQRSKRRAIYLKPNDETVDQLQSGNHHDIIESISDEIVRQQSPSSAAVIVDKFDRNYFDFDLENNNNNNSDIIDSTDESNRIDRNDQNDAIASAELQNALLNTVVSNRFGICEFSNSTINTIDNWNKNSNNSNNSNNNSARNSKTFSDSFSQEFANDLMNTYESVLKRRGLNTKHIQLHNKTNNRESSDTNNNNNNYSNDKSDTNAKLVFSNRESESQNEIRNLYCETSSSNSRVIKISKNTQSANNTYDVAIFPINLAVERTAQQLLPNQIIRFENLIFAVNLSQCLNKITIFYDTALSQFLTYVQNTQKYSRCEAKQLVKLFEKYRNFASHQQQQQTLKANNNLKTICSAKSREKSDKNNNSKNSYENFTPNIDINLNEATVLASNKIKTYNSDSNNKQVVRKKPVPPPRRFLPHMAPALPPTPPLKPRNLLQIVERERLQQAAQSLSTSTSTNSKNIPPKVAERTNRIPNYMNTGYSAAPVYSIMRSQSSKEDDEIYQPIWKCQTTTTTNSNAVIENKNENNDSSKTESEFKSKNKNNNSRASFSSINDSESLQKDKRLSSSLKISSPSSSSSSSSTSSSPIPSPSGATTTKTKANKLSNKNSVQDKSNDNTDDSSNTEDTSEDKATPNNTSSAEEDHSQWETDDEFMFSTTTKMNQKTCDISSSNKLCETIKTNKANEEDLFYASGGESTSSTGSTLTGSNCKRISKSDPELKRDSILNDSNNNNAIAMDNQNKHRITSSDRHVDSNSWKTVCIIYSPSSAKYRKILYDYNGNQIDYEVAGKSPNNSSNNIEQEFPTTNDYRKEFQKNENSSTAYSRNDLAGKFEKRKLPFSDVNRLNELIINKNSPPFKRNITGSSETVLTSNSNKSGGAVASTIDSSNLSLHHNNSNFNDSNIICVKMWKEMLMDINYMEDEEDMFVSDEEILKVKQASAHSEPHSLQRFKSQSTDNLQSIPDDQDKKSFGERLRNKLQRGVLKLNGRQLRDNSGKKDKESFKRLNVNSVCYDDGNEPKYPIFNAELQDIEMSLIDDKVPRFVVDCIEIIEQKECVQIDGLYRASGNKVAIDELKKKLTATIIFDFKILMKHEDIHTITGLLKLFFRELKTPLIPETYYRKLPDCLADKSSLPAIKEILNEIPQPALATLKYILKHLTTVAQYSSENRMPASNLAIVWGPCILLSENIGPFDIGRMNTLAKILIENYDFVFGDDERLVN